MRASSAARYSYLLYSNSSSFFFNDTPTTEIYTLSLHDALPISPYSGLMPASRASRPFFSNSARMCSVNSSGERSEEHTSELQSHVNLVCRLLLEKKKSNKLPKDMCLNRLDG